jgi:hypothetical protein
MFLLQGDFINSISFHYNILTLPYMNIILYCSLLFYIGALLNDRYNFSFEEKRLISCPIKVSINAMMTNFILFGSVGFSYIYGWKTYLLPFAFIYYLSSYKFYDIVRNAYNLDSRKGILECSLY